LVDWWFIYKLPDGFDYAYRDSNDTPESKPHLIPSWGRSLNCTEGCALGGTLHQIYRNKSGLASVLYNDEPPDVTEPVGSHDSSDGRHEERLSRQAGDVGEGWPGNGTETAHAKGVLTYDGGGAGFWLIHSVPKFPDLEPASFTWTASSTYGQSFLCLSLDAEGVDQAAFQLRHMCVLKSIMKNIG
jgi:hypothetical protein